MRKLMSSVSFVFIPMPISKIITLYHSVFVRKKMYRKDEKSNVVCFSFNIFLSHSKVIKVYSNAIVLVLSPVIFIMPSSVNHRSTIMYAPVTKKYILQVGAKSNILCTFAFQRSLEFYLCRGPRPMASTEDFGYHAVVCIFLNV